MTDDSPRTFGGSERPTQALQRTADASAEGYHVRRRELSNRAPELFIGKDNARWHWSVALNAEQRSPQTQ